MPLVVFLHKGSAFVCWYPGDGKELIKLFILAGLATLGAREGGWRDAPLQSSKR